MMPTGDSHLHLFSNGFAGLLGNSPTGGSSEVDAYERLRKFFGIQRGLVVGYEGKPRYFGNNRYILALASTRPWMTPLPHLSPFPPPINWLRELHDRGAGGYAFYLSSRSDVEAICNWPSAIFSELRAQHALVSINAGPNELATIHTLLQNLNAERILISHLGLPGQYRHVPDLSTARERLQPLLRFASTESVSVKISGLYAISEPSHAFPHDAARPFIELLLEEFGPSRLLWGSDFPVALDFVSFAQVSDCGALSNCSSAEVAAVMGGNLLELLRHSVQPE
jgi:L-fuconolactonase